MFALAISGETEKRGDIRKSFNNPHQLQAQYATPTLQVPIGGCWEGAVTMPLHSRLIHKD